MVNNLLSDARDVEGGASIPAQSKTNPSMRSGTRKGSPSAKALDPVNADTEPFLGCPPPHDPSERKPLFSEVLIRAAFGEPPGTPWGKICHPDQG